MGKRRVTAAGKNPWTASDKTFFSDFGVFQSSNMTFAYIRFATIRRDIASRTFSAVGNRPEFTCSSKLREPSGGGRVFSMSARPKKYLDARWQDYRICLTDIPALPVFFPIPFPSLFQSDAAR